MQLLFFFQRWFARLVRECYSPMLNAFSFCYTKPRCNRISRVWLGPWSQTWHGIPILFSSMRSHSNREGNIKALYIKRKSLPQPSILDEKPNYNYINYEDLLDIIHKTKLYFNSNYHLFVTEVLRENKYKTIKVYLEFPVKTTAN